MITKPKPPGKVFLGYAQKDEAFKEEFEDYLAILQQQQLIAGWVERQVQRGTDWLQIIDPRLFDAQYILLLLSPGFLASGYCSGVEIREAFLRRHKGEAIVIPILLHPVNVAGFPFETIMPTPMNGIPVSSMPSFCQARKMVDRDLRTVIKNIHYESRRTPH